MESKIPILVSRCLLGVQCRYHGRVPRGSAPGRTHSRILSLLATGRYEIVDICPEVDAGLPVPRPPTRPVDGRLICDGKDVTAVFERGAELALAAARKGGAQKAYLLKGSPACDKNKGVAALLLRANGIKVIAV